MAAVDPVAFSFGNFEIRWYGILIAIALIVGIVLSYFLARYRGERAEEVINFAPFSVVFGVIGARLLHVVVNWSHYSRDPSKIFAFREGGLAIQGVMLGGVLALLVFCRVRKLNFWLWADIMAPALVLGQAIGRWGNYFNQEAFGFPTNLPWGIHIDQSVVALYNTAKNDYSGFQYFHPTFFYEFLANLLLCGMLLFLHRLYKKRPERFPEGLIFTTYLGIYAIYRSVIEYYRIDSSEFLGIKVVYILDAITIIAVLIMINYLVKKFRLKKAQQANEGKEDLE